MQEFEHKLSFVLSVNVIKYNRLMGEDEDLTVRTITGHREMIAWKMNRILDKCIYCCLLETNLLP